jgi:hypothetical protein
VARVEGEGDQAAGALDLGALGKVGEPFGEADCVAAVVEMVLPLGHHLGVLDP